MRELSRTSVSTPSAPSAIGPYSQGIAAGGLVFVSGQLPVDPETGAFVQGGIEDKTHQVLRNVKAVVEAAGSDMRHVVKTTVFLRDMADFAAMNAVYAQYFEGPPPARSAVQVAALPKNADIEIEAIAVVVGRG